VPSYTRIFKKNKDWLVRRAHLELFRGLGFGEYKRKELDLRLPHLKNIADLRLGFADLLHAIEDSPLLADFVACNRS